MASKPKAVKSPPFDPAGDLTKMTTAYQQALPGILSFEQQYRPEFQKLNLADVQQFGAGLLGLAPQFTQGTAEQLGAARQAELGQMTGQAGMTRGLIGALSPEQAAVVQAMSQAALQEYQSAQSVTPQEKRSYEQTAREGAQAAGRIGGNAAIASELMGRNEILSQKMESAKRTGQSLYNMASQFYTQPGLQLLGSQPLSYQTGQQMMGLGLGAIGAGTPQLFDVGSALNLGAANRQNIVNAQAANAQAQASYGAGLFGGLGALGGGIASGIGAAGGASAFGSAAIAAI